MRQEEFFPDGTRIDDWFYETSLPRLEDLGKQYVLTQYGVADDGNLYTEKIQNLIDEIHAAGGGVVGELCKPLCCQKIKPTSHRLIGSNYNSILLCLLDMLVVGCPSQGLKDFFSSNFLLLISSRPYHIGGNFASYCPATVANKILPKKS